MRRAARPNDKTPLWTLQELCRLVEEALSAEYERPQNGQVRALPNERTVRFYTTLGILDRPAEMQGRTAYYGLRHLMQIVAVKRLQVDGLPLDGIQQQLYGLDENKLAALAALPRQLLDRIADGKPASQPARSRRDGSFWDEVPAPIAQTEQASDTSAAALEEFVHGLQLNEQVLLVLRGGAALSNADREALKDAARPLLAALRRRGLLPS